MLVAIPTMPKALKEATEARQESGGHCQTVPVPLTTPYSPTSPCADAVLPGGRRMAVTGTLLAHSWARLVSKCVAGAAVCPEHTRLKKAPTTSQCHSRSP